MGGPVEGYVDEFLRDGKPELAIRYLALLVDKLIESDGQHRRVTSDLANGVVKALNSIEVR